MRQRCYAWFLALAIPFAHAHDEHGDSRGRPPEQLGKVSFPTSCDPQVQAQFERGVALLHSFWFPEGLKAFGAVAEQDPSCGMAYWGIAINRLLNPFNGEAAASFVKQGQALKELDDAVKAYQAAQQAAGATAPATPPPSTPPSPTGSASPNP